MRILLYRYTFRLIWVIRADAIGATCGNCFEKLRVIHVRWQRTQEHVTSNSENLICFWWLCAKMRLIFVTLLLNSFVFVAEVTCIMPYSDDACNFWGNMTIYASVLFCYRWPHAFAVVRTGVIDIDIRQLTHSRLPIRMGFQWDHKCSHFQRHRQRRHQRLHQRHHQLQHQTTETVQTTADRHQTMEPGAVPRDDNDAPRDVDSANFAPKHGQWQTKWKNRKYTSVPTNLCVPSRWIQTRWPECAVVIRFEF